MVCDPTPRVRALDAEVLRSGIGAQGLVAHVPSRSAVADYLVDRSAVRCDAALPPHKKADASEDDRCAQQTLSFKFFAYSES